MTVRTVQPQPPSQPASPPAPAGAADSPRPAAATATPPGSRFEAPAAPAPRPASAPEPRHVPLASLELGEAPQAAAERPGIGPLPPDPSRGHGGETVERSASPNLPLPDQQTVTSTLEFDEPFTVENVHLDLDVAHSYRGDLKITLTSPSGKSAVVLDRQGGGADDVTGTFDLSAFKGEPLQGQWKLTIEDKARLDTGTLRSWKLRMETSSNPEPAKSVEMPALGKGEIRDRYTAELHGKDGFIYTTGWGRRGGKSGNVLNVWDVKGGQPALAKTITIPNCDTLGDVQVSDDGKTMLVATNKGSIITYDLTDPANPRQLAELATPEMRPEVHTAELQRVNGKLYGFLSSIFSSPPKLVIVDLSDPASPRQVKSLNTGSPYQHDSHVRDGMLYTAGWDQGMTIWDIGGGGRGGTPENPVKISTIPTRGGAVHNIDTWDDPSSGKKFALIGEEHVGSVGSSSAGDIHVVEITDPTAPKEVAFYHVDGAGTHNFSIDRERGILYAAYYNAGVRALDIRGDLTQGVKAADGRVDLGKSGREVGHALGKQKGDNYVWGVHLQDGKLYASDMLNGLVVLDPSVIKLPERPS